jgi:Uma2 family endonuclease
MLDKAQRRMTPEEFYTWQEGMDEKYELVDGFPVKMMTGASRRHDQIVLNVLAELRNQLRGTNCRGFTADTTVVTMPGTRRRPDAGVECGPLRDNDYAANEPKLVVEVLSPSTREYDLFNKIQEYKGLESLQYVLFIEPHIPQAFLWSRGQDSTWSDTLIEGLEAEIALPGVGVSLKLDDVYAGLTFRPGPRLVGESSS